MSLRLGPIPPASSETTRRIMAANRGRDTKLEKQLMRSLDEAGINAYASHYRIAGRRVDLAFPLNKVAVQIHGCFWHHCSRCNPNLPKTHRSYWKRKFLINRSRDKRIRTEMRREGWSLVEVWEHEIDEDLDACVGRIVRRLSVGQART